jgi:hypothetical protein
MFVCEIVIPDGNGYNQETFISPVKLDQKGSIMTVNVSKQIKPVKTRKLP